MTTTRRATADDLPFIEEVFILAADWNPADVKGAAHWRSQPVFAKYTEGFPRPGDLGFIAMREGQDVGAIWSRFFPADAPGYGFVSEDIPEISLGVVPGRRGEGIGSALLRALIAATPGDLSLSVEDGNPAEELYRKNGFVPVGRVGGATTMVRRRPEFR